MWITTIDEVDNNIQGNGVTSGWRCSCSPFLRPKNYWFISQAETNSVFLENSKKVEYYSVKVTLDWKKVRWWRWILDSLLTLLKFDFLAASIIRFPKLAQHLAQVARCISCFLSSVNQLFLGFYSNNIK